MAAFGQLLLPLGLTASKTEYYWLPFQCLTNDINKYTNLPNTNASTPYTKTWDAMVLSAAWYCVTKVS